MNTLWLKIIVIIAFVTLIAGLLFIIKVQHDQKQEQQRINASLLEMQRMQEEVVRSQNRFVSDEDFKKIAKKLEMNYEAIEKDLEKLGAVPKIVETTRIITSGVNVTNQPTQPGLVTNPNSSLSTFDKYGYWKLQQIYNIEENFGDKRVPFGKIGFRAWDEKPWDINVYPRTYKLNTISGQDEEGRLYSYHQFSIETQGKKYLVPITESKLEQKLPESKLRFNPRIYIGIDGGMSNFVAPKPEINPNITIALASVGPTKTNSEWVIGNIGFGFQSIEKELNIVLSPIGYNIGYRLPLIDNLIIGPSASINFKGNFGIYLGIKAGL